MQQNVYVTQNNRGCFSGCGTAFAVILLIGIAVQYWYVSVALVVIGAAVGVWYYRTQRAAVAAGPVGGAESGRLAAAPGNDPAAARTCASCGELTAGNFCSHCGAAQSRTCAGCGKPGLLSAYCPECGAATYTPPTPT
ncbi:hypothetical protein [Candidatus Solirubrobacter pratensis]|uniref:hypothetical protein n=1 Tax=Candidatus Solirubrobacter pratensis TaxID=1298857 RepID=UPI0003F8A212|nr:hypothetical protein [Candidatus Solirubrobacter pratensis]